MYIVFSQICMVKLTVHSYFQKINTTQFFFFNIYLEKNNSLTRILLHVSNWTRVLIGRVYLILVSNWTRVFLHASKWTRVIIHESIWTRVLNTRVQL
jgi:hypothetical protein